MKRSTELFGWNLTATRNEHQRTSKFHQSFWIHPLINSFIPGFFSDSNLFIFKDLYSFRIRLTPFFNFIISHRWRRNLSHWIFALSAFRNLFVVFAQCKSVPLKSFHKLEWFVLLRSEKSLVDSVSYKILGLICSINWNSSKSANYCRCMHNEWVVINRKFILRTWQFQNGTNHGRWYL